MTRIIHMRGDVIGMLILFVVAFLGIWQIVVARLRLNGLSITGYPDRGCFSKIIGAVLLAGSCSWYFSQPGHFASPDVEGLETLVLLVVGLVAATVLQVLLAVAVRQIQRTLQRSQKRTEETEAAEGISVDAGGTPVDARYLPGSRDEGESSIQVLLLHDYGGRKEDLSMLAVRLAGGGHATLAVDLDGHGESPRAVSSPAMADLLDSAASALRRQTGEQLLAVVGVGFGGVLAMDLLARGVADQAVAVDPPARDERGFVRVNVFREFGPVNLFAAFIKPRAVGPGGKRVSLSRLLVHMPAPAPLSPHKVAVIGTSERWLNSPAALTSFAGLCGVSEPVLLPGNHSSVAAREETAAAILGMLGSD
jgi:pimeloyl-ACP methyl ester carboxylesterase